MREAHALFNLHHAETGVNAHGTCDAKLSSDMNPERSHCRGRAFTLIEMLCVIGIIAILAAMLLPTLNKGKAGARRIQCVGNLKQMGIAFNMFAHDHRGRFPMQLPAKEGGSEEFVKSGYSVTGEFYFSFRHFQPLSNVLVSTKLLVCPSDLARSPAASFARLNNTNLSYFVGVSAEPGNVNSILSGDGNLANDRTRTPSIFKPEPGGTVRWTRELHQFKGNLLYADGHVDEVNSLRFAQNTKPGGDLFLPSTNRPGGLAYSGDNRSTPAQRISSNAVSSNRSPTNVTPEIVRQPQVTSLSLQGQALSSSPPPVDPAKKPETNAIVAGTPTPTPTAQDSGGSPFMQWFADMAKQIVDVGKWLLWLLLLLLLILLVALRLRQLARRKER